MTRYNIDTCALLVELSVSQWTARKLDKSTTEELVKDKNAQDKGAARVNKHLLAGRSELEVINQYVTETRGFVYDNTLPWSDSGIRLLPSAKFMEFNDQLREREDKFYGLVQEFVTVYPSLITAQAMALGDMFNRTDYPSADDIAHRFSFNVNYMPVPASGDFRVDVGNEAQKELQEKLSKLADQRVESAINGFKQRLLEHLKRMSDRLGVDVIAGEAKPRKFHETLLENAHELCDLAQSLNIINDPQIEEARKALKKAINGVDIKDLRKDMGARTEVKSQVDDILNKFSF
jgi:Protein of unknown function (DUF3150)